jgi:hypothetical protein
MHAIWRKRVHLRYEQELARESLNRSRLFEAREIIDFPARRGARGPLRSVDGASDFSQDSAVDASKPRNVGDVKSAGAVQPA